MRHLILLIVMVVLIFPYSIVLANKTQFEKEIDETTVNNCYGAMKSLAARWKNGTIILWDLDSLMPIKTLKTDADANVNLSPMGDFLVISKYENSQSVIEIIPLKNGNDIK